MTDSADDTAAPDSESPLLQVVGLEAGYGDLRAVWDASIEASSGKVSLLLGRNGAGKTTLLRAISGLTAVRSGQVLFGGVDVSKLPAHRRAALGISFTQEGKRIFADRTIEENILLGTYRVRMKRAERRAACERAYEFFPILGQRRGRRAGSLSGGQQQMLAIAGALASDPSLLLLDEPSAGLAPAIVDDVLAVVRQQCDRGLAVLLVEQNAERALTIADHVTVLDIGRVVVDMNASDPEVPSLIRAAYFDVEAK